MDKLKQAKIANRIQEILEIVEGDTLEDGELREGLQDTPDRVAKAYATWFGGYEFSEEDIASVLKVFEDGAEGTDEMVIVKDIPVWSHCEHHMAPFFGTATIAYIPKGKIVGLSKLTRLVEVFARRLQVQERLTTQIADALNKHLKPAGVAVYINCRHSCVESRGVRSAGQSTVTSKLLGSFKDNVHTRAEFMAIATK